MPEKMDECPPTSSPPPVVQQQHPQQPQQPQPSQAKKRGRKPNLEPKLVQQCQICHQKCQYQYYGTFCCEACKQFFRRMILRQHEPTCRKQHLGCDCDIMAGDRCQSCRFDRCLQVGMDPRTVNNVRKHLHFDSYFGRLDIRRNRLLNEQRQRDESEGEDIEGVDEDEGDEDDYEKKRREQMQIMLPTFHSASPFGCIPKWMAPNAPISPPPSLHVLTQMELCYHRIWYSDLVLPEEYMSKNKSFKHFLSDPNNILGTAHKYILEYGKPKEPTRSMEIDSISQDLITYALRDRCLCVEFVKGLRFFNQLQYEDQVRHLRHIIVPLNMFFSTYYSLMLGEDTWTHRNGFKNRVQILSVYNDPSIQKWTKQLYCDTIQALKEVNLSRDEFVHLLATLLASSNASDLSPSAREILYEQSVANSKALLQLLQAKYGLSAGSQKYAQAMHLLTFAFKFEERSIEMATYLDIFYNKKKNPRPFDKVFSNTPLDKP